MEHAARSRCPTQGHRGLKAGSERSPGACTVPDAEGCAAWTPWSSYPDNPPQTFVLPQPEGSAMVVRLASRRGTTKPGAMGRMPEGDRQCNSEWRIGLRSLECPSTRRPLPKIVLIFLSCPT